LLSTQPEYAQWYNNHKYYVSTISVEEGGTGYSEDVPPTVTITGGGGTGATAQAVITGTTVTSVVVINPGGGYTTTPTVGFNTGTARAYVHLGNDTVRNVKVTMKFDRVTYNTNVIEWAPLTDYEEDDQITYAGIGYIATTDFTSGETFSVTDLAIVTADSYDNANDRTWAYYQPTPGMIGRDLTQIFDGLEYRGVEVIGPVIGGDGEFDTVIDGGLLTTNFDGLRPAQMDVDGGAFLSTYSTYAPEELLPGRCFETIDIQVFNTDPAMVAPIIGYRVFQNVTGAVEYLRISDANTTALTNELLPGDDDIVVDDNTVLGEPDISTQTPGVIFVNGERITYYVRDVDGVTLSQLRRGTAGTGVAESHAAATRVVDGGVDQIVPDTDNARIDSVLEPWQYWTRVVETNAEVYGDINSAVGDKVLVWSPDDVNNTQEEWHLLLTLGIETWTLVQAYIDPIWYDAGAGTASDGLGLEESSTTQAAFLKASPAFTP
jgi:hypothetical protein